MAALLLVMLTAASARADLVRLTGPTTVVTDTRALVRFDAAFDTVNQVYLVVWGTQSPGPVNGLFLDVNGQPIGGRFPISAGPEQSGWARVIYSAEQQRFLVSYTKILSSVPPLSHQRIIRFVAYSAGSPTFLTNEIVVDAFGFPGSQPGMAYSTADDVFYVTWWEWDAAFPQSYVAAVAPDGTILASHLLTDPADGQSDPNIACNDAGRCLVVGFSWGEKLNAPPNPQTVWGRFIDGPTGTPAGASSFYVNSYPTQDDSRVIYNPATGKFFVVFVRGLQAVWGMEVDNTGGLGTPFVLMQSTNPGADGGGYGVPGISYNTASNTMMLTAGSWAGLACALELTPSGTPIGAIECQPGGAYDTHFTVSVADPVNKRFVLLDNQRYYDIRSTTFDVSVPANQPPVIDVHPLTQAVVNGGSAVLNVVVTGTPPFSYQWYQGQSPNTSLPIAGATSSNYTTPVLTSAADYWVRVTNAFGTADSNTATVTPITVGTGGIVQLVGPTVVANDSRALVRFDAAFDEINQVYLVVWGTQQSGPVNGQFLDKDGKPVGSAFAISSGPEQSGWARVVYSKEQQRFLVSYTKILSPNPPLLHQRAMRFLAYAGGSANFLTGEIVLDTFGHPGSQPDLAYSPADDVFYVTWWEWDAAFPQSFVAAVAPDGTILATHLLTDPADGQSDPEIACSDTGRCLVVGFSWGNYAAGKQSVWGRIIDGPLGTPVGQTSFYVDTTPGNAEDNAFVVYNPLTARFLVVFVRDLQSIWAKVVDQNGGLGTAYLLKQSTDPAVDGGGYGVAGLSFNPSSTTFLLSMGSWAGYACAQELSFVGVPIGPTACLPGTQYATHWTVSVADPVNTRFMLLDNQDYYRIRATAFGATPVAPPPPPLVDLNGDGNGDVFTYHPSAGTWARAVAQPGGGFAASLGSWVAGWSVWPARFDTDGSADLFLSNPTTGRWFRMVSNGNGFTTQATGVWWPGWQKYVLDLDGDGISDVFLYDPVSGQWFKCLSTPTGFTYFQGWWSPGWEVTPMNLNGDASDDLFLIDRTTGRWFWAVSQAGGGFTYPQTKYWAPDWALYPGDFNGDGLDDLFLYRPAAGQYYVAMNTGAGYTYTSGGGWTPNWTPTVADLDGNGNDDLLLYNPATGRWFQMLGDGAGHFSVYDSGYWSTGWDVYPTDFNGDGRTDFLLYNPTTGHWFQALTTGSFSYSSGVWSPGLTILAGQIGR